MRLFILSCLCAVLTHRVIESQTTGTTPQQTWNEETYGRLQELGQIMTRINRRIPLFERLTNQCETNVNRLTTIGNRLQNQADSCLERAGHTNDSVQSIFSTVRNLEPVDFVHTDDSETGEIMWISLSPSVRECIHSFDGEPIHRTSAQIVCLLHYLWDISPNDPSTRTDIERIRDLVNVDDVTLPRSGHRVRKEYRCMTLEERTRFQAAMRRAHDTGMLAAFARVHRSSGVKAHRGPAFLLWHRPFVALFEECLRRFDKSVVLPYWDPTIDHALGNPVSSTVWNKHFFGTGAGDVDDGPFANYTTHNGRLQRLYGTMSRLVSKMEIEAILDRCSLESISRPVRQSLELLHDFVHSYVGGDMGAVSTAAYDPIFYMLHCYVDYVWEMFRLRQLRQGCNRDPTTDYPTGTIQDGHALHETMVGMDYFSVGDGLAEWWTGGQNPWYTYEPTPTCGDCCGSIHLQCNLTINECAPHSRLNITTPEAAQESIRMLEHEVESEAFAMPHNVNGTSFEAAETESTIVDAIHEAEEAIAEKK